MATTKVLSDLQKDVLSRLNEASDSPVGEFHAGDGTGIVVSTTQTLNQYLNDGAYDIAKSCYALFGSATIPFSANQRTAALQTGTVLSPYAGGSLWAVRQAQWTPSGGSAVPLQRCNRSFAEIWFPFYATEGTAAAPLYWYLDGLGSVALAPIPSGAGTLTVNGLIIPPDLVNPTDQLTWIEPDLYKLLVYYAAAQVALKNLEDPALKERAGIWQQEFEQGKQKLFNQLVTNDPRLARAHFAATGPLDAQNKS